jgi:hypothetical protein
MLEVFSYYAETVLMLARYEILAKPTSYTMIEEGKDDIDNSNDLNDAKGTIVLLQLEIHNLSRYEKVCSQSTLI